jgi:hypothetical protein
MCARLIVGMCSASDRQGHASVAAWSTDETAWRNGLQRENRLVGRCCEKSQATANEPKSKTYPINNVESVMSKSTKNRCAPASARKTGKKTYQAAKIAAAQRRGRTAWERRRAAALARIYAAGSGANLLTMLKACCGSNRPSAFPAAHLLYLRNLGDATEAAIAKTAGYKTWAAFEAAQAGR